MYLGLIKLSNAEDVAAVEKSLSEKITLLENAVHSDYATKQELENLDVDLSDYFTSSISDTGFTKMIKKIPDNTTVSGTNAGAYLSAPAASFAKKPYIIYVKSIKNLLL